MLITVAKRLGGAVVVVFVVVTITFTVAHVVPSDPARAAAGIGAAPDQVAETARALGLDRPFFSQYFGYLGGLTHGDFGISYATRQPLAPDLWSALPATLELVLYAFLLYVIIGVGTGLWWAVRKGKPDGVGLGIMASVASSLPVFWLAIVAQVWISGNFQWFPVNGRFSLMGEPPRHLTGLYTIDALLTGNWTAFEDAFQHLVLPVLVLVIWMYALASRITQKSVTAELQSPYVRTAMAKGASQNRIIFRHVLRNAMNPVLTILGLQFGWLLGGTVLVEVVFTWPGIGNYMYSALGNFDFPVITAVAVIVTVGFVLVNLIVDLIYPVLDPRIRRA
jgi:ABC-type dipeptide/oligopeptide/nickel transport system permease component